MSAAGISSSLRVFASSRESKRRFAQRRRGAEIDGLQARVSLLLRASAPLREHKFFLTRRREDAKMEEVL